MAMILTRSADKISRPTILARLVRVIALSAQRARERRALDQLDDFMLGDLGLSRHEIDRECHRWPWDGVYRE
jgi:uncharacterized protein YjiS (DUF1127 family)